MKTALMLSGGMDSVAIAFWQRPTIAVTIDYGQKPAAGEIRASAAVCADLEIEHHVIRADLSAMGSGDMAGNSPLAIAPVPEWWPYRNQALVTLTAMKVLALGVQHLSIGTLKTDAAHRDGSPEFIAAMNALLALQEGAMTLTAPAVGMNAAELIRVSRVPMEILSWAHSCHVSEYACGVCRGCHKHYETMRELGATPY